MDKILIAIFAVLGGLALIFLLAIFSGFTISTLWGWFVVPLGVKAISYANAYGLAILVSVFMGMRGLADDNDSMKNILFKGIFINIFALLFGYIAVQFM